MTCVKWLQLSGSFFELLGLIAVAIGLVDTRRAFTDKPPVLKALTAFLGRLTARIARILRRGRTEHRSGSLSLSGTGRSSGKMRGIATPGFHGTQGERQERAEIEIKKHAEQIQNLRYDLIDEQEARAELEKGLRRAIGEAESRLTKRIADAVAGGLTLESWGLASFMLGLILQATGGALQ